MRNFGRMLSLILVICSVCVVFSGCINKDDSLTQYIITENDEMTGYSIKYIVKNNEGNTVEIYMPTSDDAKFQYKYCDVMIPSSNKCTCTQLSQINYYYYDPGEFQNEKNISNIIESPICTRREVQVCSINAEYLNLNVRNMRDYISKEISEEYIGKYNVHYNLYKAPCSKPYSSNEIGVVVRCKCGNQDREFTVTV